NSPLFGKSSTTNVTLRIAVNSLDLPGLKVFVTWRKATTAGRTISCGERTWSSTSPMPTGLVAAVGVSVLTASLSLRSRLGPATARLRRALEAHSERRIALRRPSGARQSAIPVGATLDRHRRAEKAAV